MRELKFRAWDTEAKCYIKDPILVDNFGQVYVVCEESSHERGTCLITHKPNVILERHTELDDKNGEDISEGDIVGDYYDEEEVGYIVFEDGGFCVNWAMNQENLDGDLADTLIVIGNIHENPELLEEQ